MDGVPVEVVHATLFSRQSWLVLLVDLVAACSVYEPTYEDEGYMSWETPDLLYPGFHTTNYSFGLGGKLLQPTEAREEGYLMEKYNTTVEISIPYDAEGGYRKSVVAGGLFEFFIYDFYTEQISVDEDNIETRIRTQRTMRTPLLKQTLLDENQTVLEEQRFTIYLGNIPQDVQLISIELNGLQFKAPFRNDSTFSVIRVVHTNNTSGYTLTVPFHNSLVIQQKLSKEDIQFKLDINYALMVTPENQLYNHSASYVAILPDLSPPQFDASCSESGISFKLEYKPSDYKWEITVDSEPLTSELAAKQGLLMSNNSQTLQLDAPLHSNGYEKKNFSLQGFFGTFEIHAQDREKPEVQSSTMKTCPFFTNEFIVCTTRMTMTAIVDLSLAAASGGVPSKMTLLQHTCGPIEADTTRALFSFPMNDCGSTVKLGVGTVTYENEILYSNKDVGDSDRVFLQCTYPVTSLHRLFSAMSFESDTPGAGRIIHTAQSALQDQQSTTKSAALPPRPKLDSSARYIKVGFRAPQRLHGKRLDGIKVHAARKVF